VIAALLTTRIVVQFIGQIVALILLRRYAPNMNRPYRVWLYPLPCVIALIGWVFLFVTTQPVKLIWLGLLTLALGVVFYVIWSRTRRAA
jgi:amino acid transporter